MVEDAQEEYDIERSKAGRIELHDVDDAALDIAVQRSSRQVERSLGAPPFTLPDERVGREDVCGTSTFALEGHCSVPSPDVQHRKAVEPLRQPQPGDLGWRVVEAWGHDSVAKVDLMEPLELGDRSPKLVNLHFASLSAVVHQLRENSPLIDGLRTGPYSA